MIHGLLSCIIMCVLKKGGVFRYEGCALHIVQKRKPGARPREWWNTHFNELVTKKLTLSTTTVQAL